MPWVQIFSKLLLQLFVYIRRLANSDIMKKIFTWVQTKFLNITPWFLDYIKLREICHEILKSILGNNLNIDPDISDMN